MTSKGQRIHKTEGKGQVQFGKKWFLRRPVNRSMCWEAMGPVDLYNVPSCKTCFYVVMEESWKIGREGMFENHRHISRADQGLYFPREYLMVWLNKKREWGDAVLKNASGHGAVIMADLSKMASARFTQMPSTW